MKKIMFNDKYGLTQAVLDGRKTMTRRISKEQIRNSVFWKSGYESIHGYEIKPIYEIGEVVAIAQSYRDVEQEGYPVDSRYDAFRTANWGDGEDGALKSSAGWNNKLFVRADLMPHHIEIIGIKVERLQDISNEDCLKEGIEEHLKGVQYGFSSNIGYCGQYPFSNPREAFASLIDKVARKGTWDSNPYVFAYKFELVD